MYEYISIETLGLKYLSQKFSLNFDKNAAEYFGCFFEMNNRIIHYRKAKVTPKKVGGFLAFYKRDNLRRAIPFSYADKFHFLFIEIVNQNKLGFFVFSKKVLVEQGVISTEISAGKRGFRVYPPWVRLSSNQAIKTKKWQVEYFVNSIEDARIMLTSY